MAPKKIIYIIFVIFLVLQSLSELFPKYNFREYLTFTTLPLLLLFYFTNKIKINYLYVVAICLLIFATTLFNIAIDKIDNIGLLISSLVNIIYIYIVFTKKVLIPVNRYWIFSLVFSLVFIPLSYSILKDVDTYTFFTSLLYGATVGFFTYLSVSNFVHNKKRKHLFLATSGICLTICAIVGGYNSYLKAIPLLRAIEVAVFTLAHYFMCKYVIESSKLDSI